MSITSRAVLKTTDGRRQVHRLVKHWGHRATVTVTAGGWIVDFGRSTCEFAVTSDDVTVIVKGDDEAGAPEFEQVVAEHLNRMAFRDGSMTYDWTRVVE